MRKQTKTLIGRLLPLALLFGCGPSSLTVPQVEEGWDVYTGGVYRYGPSIMLGDDGSIDAWFAAPGGYFDGRNLKYDDTAAPHAVSLGRTHSAAQRFAESEPFYAVRVVCPNRGARNASLTLSLYAWQDDYATTVARKPVAVRRFENYKDNQSLEVTCPDRFPSGDYLWVLDGGSNDNSMVWRAEAPVSGVTNYFDGEPVGEGSYRARVSNERSDGGFFWDQASWQRSQDGGRTWTPEKMVLLPTEYASDHFSVCDPGLARWGGYYYAGYTSTENEGMVENHVYIARSRTPEGPWEKWNGTGWTTGTDVRPMILFTGDPTRFGAGEPSIVVLRDTVYFYYTWNDTGDEAVTTRLATADARDPLWPARLTFHGTVINKSDIPGADHCDVKYREDIGKFQAIHTAGRMGPKSYIVLWESSDGIRFERAGELRDNLEPYLHNCGWSGDSVGHMKRGVQQYISYAYGSDTSAWGQWNTRWSPIRLTE
ncbi:hypothetical protein [uncultured Alistipes sp.]|uniref:hypothetical protein n=1 Tax=uncultured Alistipes sp. TaxID=538949 RepID=UPI0026351C19|nr:hypothetical protein [uncultured Alistipes sp.]